ncbi:tetratricopeptide repeat protein [Sedimentisphaera salicampi]|uniref:Tetratricopeptide repeat protein n=1 Tax=Sedimentisphaera salicampi TaxID=1941349 RepID=A0A1W6LNC9_9BACT|nr:tetratricopeptide repeat protein [Sedimentisphaera salicampi]ARN57243.1 tetratricopeptide repeat protein [Sedimentisphaera salicampi]OXU14684.1 tetratricopeptide repeat protein [Sedimentisphaera salicampi]
MKIEMLVNLNDSEPKNSVRSVFAAVLLLILLCVVSAPCKGAEKRKIKLKPEKSAMTELDLKIWNDPEFKKRFAESYMAETEVEPRVTKSERKVMMEIMDLISEDKMNEAAEMLKEQISEASSAVFDFTLANIHFQNEELKKAIKPYNNAVEKFSRFRRAWKNLALIHFRLKNHKKAAEAFTKYLELGGKDSISYGLLGFCYSSMGKSVSAESAYRMAILLDPETLDWKMGLARSFFRQERFGAAAALCGKLIEKNPDRPDLWLLQANAYIGQNKPLEAAEVFEFVDHLGKSTADTLNMLGDIYVNEKLYDMAADSYVRAMKKNPDENLERAIYSAKVLSARAAMEETKQLIKEIQKLYADTMKDQTRKELLKIQARIAVAEGEGEEEVEVLKKIVELDPLDGEALILLGQNAARKGNDEKAIFYFERASKIEGCEADAKLRHGQLLVRNGQYKKALPLLRRAQTLEPRENVQKYLEQVERIAKQR